VANDKLGQARRQQGAHDQAVEAYTCALAHHPGYPPYLSRRAAALRCVCAGRGRLGAAGDGWGVSACAAAAPHPPAPTPSPPFFPFPPLSSPSPPPRLLPFPASAVQHPRPPGRSGCGPHRCPRGDGGSGAAPAAAAG
jgi:hypothetical protein